MNTELLTQAQQAPNNAIQLFKEELSQFKQRMDKEFAQNYSANKIIFKISNFIDQLLLTAWKLKNCSEHPLCLVAVGGYGRGELHPGSDIDLLIITEDKISNAAKSSIEKLLTFLWDIGLEVGQSVRNLEECVAEAKADITVISNLVESRFLDGDTKLYQSMLIQTHSSKIWSSEEFFRAKFKEQKARYAKYDDTAYNLEPNIKECPGGLRDIHVIGWVAKRHYDVNTIDELVKKDFITEPELKQLKDSQDFLWKIRYALHIRNNRREDRLLFDHQRYLAEQFGYQDNDQYLAVEQFMQDYFRNVAELNRLNEMLLQLFSDDIIQRDPTTEIIAINKRFQARKGFIEFINDTIIQHDPTVLLEIFYLQGQNPELKGVQASSVRLIRSNIHLIDDAFRANPKNQQIFMDILRSPVGVTHQLRQMNRYGVLAAYIPAYANIVGRMQYDLFHVYTVDEHSLFVVRNLRRFTVKKFKQEFPLASKIITRLKNPELVYIAGLFHDIAKGRGGDHSTLGAEDATLFCEQHGITAKNSRLVSWLVQNHLVMSMTAQRKDTSDPDIIAEFAKLVGDVTHLDCLYLLTVADMRATSPKLWNSWKNSLMISLYTATKTALVTGLENPIDKTETITDVKQHATELLRSHGLEPKDYQSIWNAFTDDYFLHYLADDINWHTQAILADTPPISLTRRNYERGSTEVMVISATDKESFAIATAVLDRLRLTVMDARVMRTNNRMTLYTFQILEENGQPISDENRIIEIQHTLNKQLKAGNVNDIHVNRRLSRQAKYFINPTKIKFSTDSNNNRTIIEINTTDYPGMLSDIAKVFLETNTYVQNARIATFGNRAEDVFFLNNEQNAPLTAEHQKILEQCISETLK